MNMDMPLTSSKIPVGSEHCWQDDGHHHENGGVVLHDCSFVLFSPRLFLLNKSLVFLVYCLTLLRDRRVSKGINRRKHCE